MTLEERAFRKATRRLIPFLFLIYVVAYLDRVNVSFAQLQLEDDLDFSDTIFGIGAGIFSLGYVIFGVPSNLALARFGARRWLAAIMVVVGSDLGVDDVHRRPRRLLRAPLPARRRRGRLLPGDHPVPDLVVPGARAHPARSRCSSPRCRWRTCSAARSRAACSSSTASPGLDGWQWLFLIEGLPGDRARVRDAALPRRAARGRGLARPRRARVPRSRGRGASTSCARRSGASACATRSAAAQRVGVRARQLRAARGRLRAHLLRAPPRPGPDRLHGLRGGRARGDPVRVRRPRR